MLAQVGTHGAQLANGLLMPPGTSVVEIRAWEWFNIREHDLKIPSDWSNLIWQKFLLKNTTLSRTQSGAERRVAEFK